MAKKDLIGKPHTAKSARYPGDEILDVWWYEKNAGIEIYVQSKPTIIVKIPWKSIRNALKRKDQC